jgi:hypothetical protein
VFQYVTFGLAKAKRVSGETAKKLLFSRQATPAHGIPVIIQRGIEKVEGISTRRWRAYPPTTDERGKGHDGFSWKGR